QHVASPACPAFAAGAARRSGIDPRTTAAVLKPLKQRDATCAAAVRPCPSQAARLKPPRTLRATPPPPRVVCPAAPARAPAVTRAGHPAVRETPTTARRAARARTHDRLCDRSHPIALSRRV